MTLEQTSVGRLDGTLVSPYPGLDAFGEHQWDVFFGRATDRTVITANLTASRLTVLYGPSGVGKSSLLQAGVVHDLDVEAEAAAGDRYARPALAILLRNWHGDPLVELDAYVRKKAPLLRPGIDLSAIAPAGTLPDALRRWTAELDADLLVILDQFEEFFLYDAGQFADELAASSRDADLPVNFLISLREDSLADLDGFRGKLPGLLDNRLRLAHLSVESAEDAIRQPLTIVNQHLPEDQMKIIVQDGLVDAVIQGAMITDSLGNPKGVEAPFVSLVMEEIWNREAADGSHLLRADTLEQAGGPVAIVRSHVDRALARLSEEDRDVAASVFDRLLTPTGSKIALNARDLAAWTELPETEIGRVLHTLAASDVRILRTKSSELRSAAYDDGRVASGTSAAAAADHDVLLSYEVFHDLLAAGIVNWASKRRHERDAREARHREEERRARRTDVTTLVAAVVVLVMAATGAVITLVADILQNEIEIAAPFFAILVGVVAANVYRQDPTDRSGRWRSAAAAAICAVALAVVLGNGELFGADAELRGLGISVERSVTAEDFTVSVANSPGGGASVELVLPFNFSGDDEPATTIPRQARFGVVNLTDEGAIYRPAEGFSGRDSFTYKVCLSDELCDEGQIAIDVIPYALDDEALTVGGTPVTINVLANDLSTELMVVVEQGRADVAVDAAGIVTFVPPQDFTGTDTFTYRACAGDLCDSATVTIAASEGELVVPDLVGTTGADVVLRSSGFQVVLTEQRNSCVPEGAVISQDPPAGAMVVPGTQVSLVVSTGSLVPVSPGCRYDDAVLASNPLVYWPLFGEGETLVDDAVGSYELRLSTLDGSTGSLGSLPGPESMGAVAFDGSAAHLTQSRFNPADELDGDSWTVETWVKLSRADVGQNDFFTVIGAWNGGQDERWYVNVRDAGRVCLGVGATGGVCTAERQIDDGRWHHVVVAYDTETGRASVFIDAEEAGLARNPWTGGERFVDAVVAPGAMRNAATSEWHEFWEGGMTRLAVYDRVLGADEVQTHYARVVPTEDESFEVLIEAEDAQVNTLATLQDSRASGGSYVVADADHPGSAELTFEVPESGTYVIWARVNTAGYDGSNSFYVAVDDGLLNTWDIAEEFGAARLPLGWFWEQISTRCGGNFDQHLCDPFAMDLDAGSHTIRFEMRELNTRLDAIVITDTSLHCPGTVEPCPFEQ